MLKKGRRKNLNKYLFWAVIALLIILSYFIIRPFVIPLLSAFILAYLTKPLYDILNKKTGKIIAALICILLTIFVFVVPISLIIGGITNQSIAAINQGEINILIEKLTSIPIIQNLNIDFNALKIEGLRFLIDILSSSASYIPSLIITLTITFFGMYYILTRWDSFTLQLKKYIPFEEKSKLSREIAIATKNIIYGKLLMALILFLISSIGFYYLGIKTYLLFAALIFFLYIVVNPIIVWLPAAIYYALVQNYNTMIGVLILGVLISVLDFLLSIKIREKSTKTNPFIMLMGAIGGVSLFGIFGFIIGPLILIYTIKILQEAIN